MEEQSMLPLHQIPLSSEPASKAGKRKIGLSKKPPSTFHMNLISALADPLRVIFVDVETTGLSWFYDQLTLVGWYNGSGYQSYIVGNDPSEFLDAMRSARALVTFNGTLFDLKFLRKAFRDIVVPPAHFDLRYLAKRIGLTGGQKSIERELNFSRGKDLSDMDGAEAVLLWHKYLRGDDAAIARLLEYNRQDVLGMCHILDHTLDRMNIHADLLFSRPRFSATKTLVSGTSIKYKDTISRGILSRDKTFEGVFAKTRAEHATVIGIDLTGSEARPSGWCTLRSEVAETAMISTDDEMISRVLAEKPTLVSIDSPLSLPFGRTRVEDDDPARQKFGIMRKCERELKRRGVNVYPSLLPSMQGLTRRGINLAKRLRAAGIPVIESYPGAAQDIMGIPRKGAGVEFLKQGLADFGVRGSFITQEVTHDELDAITSALVGSFFLAGRYEKLDGPSEDPLIIPDLKVVCSPELVVGISGRICAGKTTAARMLERKGFSYTRFSEVIDAELEKRGEKLSRETRQQMGNEIHETVGQRWLCEKTLDRAGGSLIVIDGLRFPEDHAFFVEKFGSNFVHLYIHASDEIRASRYKSSERDGVSFINADTNPVEAEIEALSTHSSLNVPNESTVSSFEKNVLNSLRNLEVGHRQTCLFQS